MRAITTKYLGYTATKPSRVAAFDSAGNRIVISYDSDNHNDELPYRKAADALCKKLHWTGKLCGGGIKDGYVFVFCEDDPQ